MSFMDKYAEFGYKLQKDLSQVLLTDATEVVKDIMQEQLEENVYSYEATPEAMESRRYEYGGLKDRANMVSHLEPGITLVVENVAKFQDPRLNSTSEHDLSDVVDQGIVGYRQPGARPFVNPTENECVSSGRVLKSINDGLTSRGYKIEKEG
jgi:hypothetical protein